MLRQCMLLAFILSVGLLSRQLASSHCSQLRHQQHEADTFAQVAASVEVPLRLFHTAELWALGICAGTLTALFTLNRLANPGRQESVLWGFGSDSLVIVWSLSLAAIFLSAGAKVFFEGIAQGYEQSGGIHSPFMNGFGPPIVLEAASVLCTFASFYVGPPGGWTQRDSVDWI